MPILTDKMASFGIQIGVWAFIGAWAFNRIFELLSQTYP